MKRDEIEKLLREVLVDEMGVEVDAISGATTLEELDVDSLDLVEIAQIFEERTGVAIRADAASDLTTVDDVVSFLERLVAQAPARPGTS